jgi:hypothetical protein
MTALESRLALLAAQGATATYGELTRELDVRMRDLTAELERMMEADARANRPFRAALCAARHSPDALPAPGFFAKAAALGFGTDNPLAMVQDLRKRLMTGK